MGTFFSSLRNQFERSDSSHVASTAPSGSLSPSLALTITTASVFLPNVFLLFRGRQPRQLTNLLFIFFHSITQLVRIKRSGFHLETMHFTCHLLPLKQQLVTLFQYSSLSALTRLIFFFFVSIFHRWMSPTSPSPLCTRLLKRLYSQIVCSPPSCHLQTSSAAKGRDLAWRVCRSLLTALGWQGNITGNYWGHNYERG